jgi:hypothetical protein
MKSKVTGASITTKRRYPDFKFMMVTMFSMILVLASINSSNPSKDNSSQEAKDKGTEISEEDTRTTVSNDQHVLVEFHQLEHLQDKQKVGMGVIHPQTPAKQECHMSQTSKDGTTTFVVTPHAQSKTISMPAGEDTAVFVGQTGPIADPVYGREDTLGLVSKEY